MRIFLTIDNSVYIHVNHRYVRLLQFRHVGPVEVLLLKDAGVCEDYINSSMLAVYLFEGSGLAGPGCSIAFYERERGVRELRCEFPNCG